MITTKENVSLIAPELLAQIYGQYQKTRCYISELTDNVITVEDKEYIYEVQEGDTVEDVIEDLYTMINDDPDAIVSAVNSSETYIDIIGKESNPFTVSTPTTENIQEAVPSSLWDLFTLDIDDIVSEDTFTGQVERAQRYLIAHLLTIQSKLSKASLNSNEKVGDISVTYADPLSPEGLGLTGYGLIYLSIYKSKRRLQSIESSLKNYK